ncbi:MAG: hypothetical protein ACREUA_08675 [Burkholderiales bacterium]
MIARIFLYLAREGWLAPLHCEFALECPLNSRKVDLAEPLDQILALFEYRVGKVNRSFAHWT